ncbi:MAG: YggS family pyridoxal phosphate-dependent enzyme [Candidatus Omnitrophota bacterium]
MISDSLTSIKNKIASTCKKNGRNPEEITLIAVTKNISLEKIEEVLNLGIKNIADNKVQEALSKYSSLKEKFKTNPFYWHMIGHLQTNKVKDAVGLFDLIHSVDSLRLAIEINKQAAKINKIQDILIEVNTSGETTKFGIKPQSVIEIIKEIAKLKNINVKGLMTIAPLVDNPEKTRNFFRKLKELIKEFNERRIANDELRILSMGMSDDYQVAIEEGSTMIRLGRAIFAN